MVEQVREAMEKAHQHVYGQCAPVSQGVLYDPFMTLAQSKDKS
jgi:hypothetical protein